MKRILLLSCLCVMSAGIFWSCSKEESFETDQDLAQGSLHDSTDECYPISVTGTYYNGINAARDTNTIMLYVNVTQAGSYSISSTTENGFSFSDTGFFSTVGLDSIRLQATGTPILIKPTDFTVSFNQTSCSFTVNVLDSTGTGLSGSDPGTGGGTVGNGNGATYVDPSPASANSWKFTDTVSNQSYSGAVAGAFITDDGSGGSTLAITGLTSDTKAFSIAVEFPTGAAVGSYAATDNGAQINLIQPPSTILYDGSGATENDPVDPSFVNITSYDATTKKIAGSFRFWAVTPDGKTVMLKGSFNATYQ